jgi:hypothetical protein
MKKIIGKAVGSFHQVKLMSLMVFEAKAIMKTYNKDRIEEFLTTEEGSRTLASEIYPKLSDKIRFSLTLDRFSEVLVATRKGFVNKKKNKKILQKKEL